MHSRTGVLRALNRNIERTLTDRKEMHWGREAKEGPMTTVWIYVDTRYRVGDPGHLKVLRTKKLRTDGSRKMIRKASPSNTRFRNSGDGCPRSLAKQLV